MSRIPNHPHSPTPIILMRGSRPQPRFSYSISATTMKKLPDSRAGLKKPKDTAQDRSNLFDGSERNSRTILLTLPDTHSSRHVFTQTIHIPAKSYSPPKFDKKGNEIFREEFHEEVEWAANMRSKYFLTVVDEAHEIKKPLTKNWASVSGPLRT